ncbi:MAG: phosphoglucosamine mutase [Pirellulales bacterium]
MSELIITVSGLRGIVGQSLSPSVAVHYVALFAEELPHGPVVVTRDGRDSGAMYADAVRSGLTAVGRDSLDGGIAATPTTGVLLRAHAAAGGVQISASHNPSEYNGIKLFSRHGRVLPGDQGARLADRYRSDQPKWVEHTALGHPSALRDSVGRHAELVRGIVDVDRVRSRRFRVLLDANHGAGAVLGQPLLEQLGCQLTLLGSTPDGHFAHPPEPTEANLADICSAIRAAGVDIGFCQDPDADRLAVIDAEGRYLGEESTLAMCVDHVLRQRTGPVVTNCATSRMVEDLAKKHGAPFFRAAVGEANVVDSMLDHCAVLGGEGNGGVIDPRVGLVRDSFVGMALLLDAMAARDCTIGELADSLPRYSIHKTKIPLAAERVTAGLDALEDHFSDAAVDRMDGLRLDWPDCWLLVRPSNTEPIVRGIAEARTGAEAERLCAQAASVLAES